MNDAIETTNELLPSAVEGARMLVRRKRRADAHGYPLVMIHGATYASSGVFDYPRPDGSWADLLAGAGFDVWMIDLPGYGQAERPAAMCRPALAHPPLVRTAQAETCAQYAIDHVLAKTGVDKVDLLGYSWGTAIGGAVAGAKPARINKLVLLGALWIKDVPSAISNGQPPGAYREVSAEDTVKRWCIGLTPEMADAVGTEAERQAWAQFTIESDALARSNGGTLLAPAGVVADVIEYWANDKPTYDPGDIRAPTLIIMGEWDHETTPAQGREVFDRLTNAQDRWFVMIGRATHSMPLERQRDAMHKAVVNFLRD